MERDIGEAPALAVAPPAMATGNPPRRIRNNPKRLEEFPARLQAQGIDITRPCLMPS